MSRTRIRSPNIRQRKAVGSIVGTAFFVLILLSGYYFYSLMNQDVTRQEKVQTEMRNFDIERAQEKIELVGSLQPIDDYLKLEFTIKNTGQRPINITTFGLSTNINAEWSYTTIKYIVNGESHTGRLLFAGEEYTFVFHTNQPYSIYQIQLLTEKGCVFTKSYP